MSGPSVEPLVSRGAGVDSVHPDPNVVVPAIATVFPVGVLIPIARAHDLPVSMDGHVAVAFPAPVATGPDVAGTRRRFFFDDARRRRLGGDDFDVFAARRRSFDDATFMHDSLFHTAGRHHQCTHQGQIT